MVLSHELTVTTYPTLINQLIPARYVLIINNRIYNDWDVSWKLLSLDIMLNVLTDHTDSDATHSACGAGALVQWLKLPAWKVGDRRFELRSGNKVSRKQNVSSLLTHEKNQYCGKPP